MITDDPLVRSWLGAHADTIDDFVSVLLALGLRSGLVAGPGRRVPPARPRGDVTR
jgi:hypothetical protein